MKSISVIIPTHNRAHLVCDAINSVLEQDIVACCLEVIVVDDGSSDDTRQVVSAFGENVKYIYQDKQGPGVARNRGIDEASGEWIAFLDSDDLWLPDKLSLQFKVLEAFPEYKAVHSNFYTTKNGEIVIQKGLEFWVDSSEYNKDINWNQFYNKKFNSDNFAITRSGSSFDIYAGNIFNGLVGNGLAACWTLLVHRDCLAEHIRFHTESPRWQDYWFFCQLCEYNAILFMDCPTADNRGHPGARLTQGQQDKAFECYLDVCTEIYLPSTSPFRPDNEVIFEHYRMVRNSLLTIYLREGGRTKAKALIKKSKDIVAFDTDFMSMFCRIASFLPFDITNRLVIFKHTCSRLLPFKKVKPR
jgi:cellulose synthase/poly-beta-1,6-N-acetylglucosamine synthase-like glycosyltransferase